jgi:hypothetical protein
MHLRKEEIMGEIQRDNIDLSTHMEQVPKWPKKCRDCLARNRCDPAKTLFCPPDNDCPDYPFGGGNDE